MQTCETCGNQYDRMIEVRMNGKSHTFDCFECAIHQIAPRCATCGIPVIGHGVEASGVVCCCAHCARQQGLRGVTDRAS